MGKLCEFYERALPSLRHIKYASSHRPRTHFNLQSAANPRWYMGFGPHTSKALKHIGLKFSPKGHALSLPRKMPSPKMRPRNRCDFRFYSGIFKSKPSPSWSGMLDKIEDELNSVSNNNGAFKTKKKHKYSTSAKSKRISRPWNGCFCQSIPQWSQYHTTKLQNYYRTKFSTTILYVMN